MSQGNYRTYCERPPAVRNLRGSSMRTAVRNALSAKANVPEAL